MVSIHLIGRSLLEQIATFKSAIQMLRLRKEVADSVFDELQLQNLVHGNPIAGLNL